MHAPSHANFFDPNDGQLDLSQWVLDNATGFLPIPFVITEPAVGVGGGAALMFFHETDEQKQARKQDPESVEGIPLSVSGLVGAATSNGTKIYGGFHSGNWKDDHIRYLGGLFHADINLNFYEPSSSLAIPLNIAGNYFFQDIDFRLGDSPWFLGADYSFMSSTTKLEFDANTRIDELVSNDAGLGVKLSYDSRDHLFSARSGTFARLQAKRFSPNLGGDFDYHSEHAFVQNYQRLAKNWGLALRADYKAASDGAPFYAKPYIDMRGMPAMRYQGDAVALAEAQVSYDINTRWTVLAFAGIGYQDLPEQRFKNAEPLYSQGVGVRYLIARQLGLRTGVDIAKGPEEWTLNIQFGSAW
ncbi:glyceraldehyde-3-phosphate dehydrogenase [Alginatibacterium sediminis]|uniref:Glyceraldehyde-3-phosphate dehydrogenase n=1 Tax=Alginatibacterium sediminis TaxID=2164068 RepID=A0A420EBU3_9ALTE|nr:glyceraldehyde-3-phosphate dehydrogenase [Alginatibacterium sediminis]